MNVHQLALVSTDESGTEEWACPLCDMQATVRWSPRFERAITAEGEPGVTHQGRKNGRYPAGLLFYRHSAVNSADIDWLSQAGIRWTE